jgi:hypothetical protein
MILPGKHIKQDRALIAIGGDILSVLDARMNVSEIGRGYRNSASRGKDPPRCRSIGLCSPSPSCSPYQPLFRTVMKSCPHEQRDDRFDLKFSTNFQDAHV